MPSLFDYLGYAGNALDLPASSLRDLLTGNNPFDQWATPFSDRNRATGRDVLSPFLGANEETGFAGWADNPMEGLKDIAGFGAEVLLDPLNFVSGAGVVKALRGAKAAKGRNAVAAAENAAKAGKYGYVNPKAVSRVRNPITTNWQDDVARMETERLNLVGQADNEGFGTASIFQAIFGETEYSLAALDKAGLRQRYDELGNRIDEIRSQNPMKLLGYTPEPERLFHGGRDWAPSATPEKPYGAFDVNRLKSGEGGQAYGPGMYVSDSPRVSQYYQGLVQDRLARSPEVLSQYFSPGRIVPSYNGFDRVLEFSPGSGDGSDWVVKVQKVTLDDAGNVVKEGPVRHHATLPDPKEVKNLLGSSMPKARLYELDAPAGTKDQFMRWEEDLSGQPANVQNVITENPITRLLQEYRGAKEKTRDLWRRSSAGESVGAEYDAAWDTLDSLQEQLTAATGDWNLAKRMVDEDPTLHGQDMFELLAGSEPSSTKLAAAAPLAQAGIPGMSNPAAIVEGARNYAVWDTNLINQMRVRGIDGQRVPINPTTLVQQAPVQVRRAEAPLQLTPTSNPMRQMERVPSALAPAATMAVQNILARQRGPGGIQ